jgi:hypothetical protein
MEEWLPKNSTCISWKITFWAIRYTRPLDQFPVYGVLLLHGHNNGIVLIIEMGVASLLFILSNPPSNIWHLIFTWVMLVWKT